MRFLVVVLVLLLVGCSQPKDQVIRINGPTMGTSYHILWVGQNPQSAPDIQAKVEQRLADINRSMSTYDPDSELSQLNQGRLPVSEDGWIAISQDLYAVLNDALDIHRRSRGLFDVTVGPLVNLWGFGPTPSTDKAPDDEAIALARAQTGADSIELNPATSSVKLSKPLYIDLSAIAKGWAVDQLADLLRAQGISHFMVEIGGEVRTAGHKPSGQLWRIAIERPGSVTDERGIELVIEPGDSAVATSGDYRNYFEENGVRYSHTINPFTGRPIVHRLASVTVVNDSCGLADGWATALNVAGPEVGMQLAEQEQLAVFMIVRDDDGFHELASSRFRQLFPHYQSAER
ncbi:MAG: FAD:protein FMN transferase [Saccharospirillaceae bacterium]|nr:FAD:protein FMN transferase [Saccharospirillaceae bacterium]